MAIRCPRACLLVGSLLLPHVAAAQTAPTDMVPPIESMTAPPASELRDAVERYVEDRSALFRRYAVPFAPERRERLEEFYRGWQQRLQEMSYDELGVEGRIDWVLLDHRLRYELETLEREGRELAEMQDLLPFATTIIELERERRDMKPVDARGSAERLVRLVEDLERTRTTLESATTDGNGAHSRIVAFRAVGATADLRQVLEGWYRNYAGYDPLFGWWVEDPFNDANAALEAYESFLREELVGIRPGQPEPIIGDPIGTEGLRSDLNVEMIPYTPAELIEIAEREFAWCEAEMLKASREMGFGDDWRAALEKVKTLHVEPGRQPEVVRDLAHEAVAFLEQHDLVTIPPLAEEIWRIEMMSPERQLVNPFFTGGETIRVSYPTDEMEHADKLMSMRGNNPHFSRATVHHELIPGHHLQGFMTDRYNSHREVFRTPFWGEGWALYWEMLLWDMGFPRTPEDRVGFLFWRSHRAARIIFSLSFHLGTMTPEEAMDFLVERVGHEPANAEAEVRRSFNGTYPPLYQAGYMLGGLQIRALHRDLVESGRMTNREFHDAILRGGRMPIEMVRARLLGERVGRDYRANWRF
jgi:hypothetical protein